MNWLNTTMFLTVLGLLLIFIAPDFLCDEWCTDNEWKAVGGNNMEGVILATAGTSMFIIGMTVLPFVYIHDKNKNKTR
jgi:hypothetical protein